jgi:hypothetical protein
MARVKARAAAEGRATAALTDSVVKAIKVADMTATRALEEHLDRAVQVIETLQAEVDALRRSPQARRLSGATLSDAAPVWPPNPARPQ